MQAKQVVILTPASAQINEDNSAAEEIYNEQEKLRDAKTLFIYNVIKKKNPRVNVVTELVD